MLIKLELLHLRQALVDLKTLVESKSTGQIPTTDYLPALKITSEALEPALEFFSLQKLPQGSVKAVSLWEGLETQQKIRKYLSRFKSARAALIAAQLVVYVSASPKFCLLY